MTQLITDEAAIAQYVTAVLEADDPDLLLLALADIARAKKACGGGPGGKAGAGKCL